MLLKSTSPAARRTLNFQNVDGAPEEEIFRNSLNIELKQHDIVVMGHGMHGQIEKFIKMKRSVKAEVRYFDKNGETYEAGDLICSKTPDKGLPWYTTVHISAIITKLNKPHVSKEDIDKIMKLTEQEYDESSGF